MKQNDGEVEACWKVERIVEETLVSLGDSEVPSAAVASVRDENALAETEGLQQAWAQMKLA